MQIKLARETDLDVYTDLMQRTYQATFPNEAIGLTKECFSKEVLATDFVQDYFKSKLAISPQQKTWLAFEGSELVAAITISNDNIESKLSGFYVSPDHQGKGIGRKLYELALEFAQGKDIVLDVIKHNTKAIEMYMKWGFVVDTEKKSFSFRWEQWPKDVQVEAIYMKKTAVK